MTEWIPTSACLLGSSLSSTPIWTALVWMIPAQTKLSGFGSMPAKKKKLYNTLVFMVHLLVAGSHSQWVSFLLPPHFPSDTQPWRSFDSPEHNFVQSVSVWHDTVMMTGHVFIIFYFSAIFLTWEGMLRFFQREKNASPFISVGSMNLFTEIWKSVIWKLSYERFT